MHKTFHHSWKITIEVYFRCPSSDIKEAPPLLEECFCLLIAFYSSNKGPVCKLGQGPWAMGIVGNAKPKQYSRSCFAVKKHFWLLNSGRPSLRGNNLDDVCPTGTTVLMLRKKKACQAKDPKPQPSEPDPGLPASNFMSLVRRIPPLLPSPLQGNPHIVVRVYEIDWGPVQYISNIYIFIITIHGSPSS